MRPFTYKSEQVWCENCGTIPRTSESDTSVWYVGWLSRRFPCARCHNPFIWGAYKSCQAISCQEITFGLLAAACSPSPECVWGWRGKSVSAAEIRLKSKTLGIFILHVGLVSAATRPDYMLDLNMSVLTYSASKPPAVSLYFPQITITSYYPANRECSQHSNKVLIKLWTNIPQ